MSTSILSAPHFHNEEAAYRFVEARLWPNGPICPRCKGSERIGKMGGKTTRIGTYKCYECRKPFTVKVGTIFESSHVKMHLWLQAIFLIASSKKGISSNQLHRTLGVTLKTAWFMSHRIREAMREPVATSGPLGGKNSVVETDETDGAFVGHEIALTVQSLCFIGRSKGIRQSLNKMSVAQFKMQHRTGHPPARAGYKCMGFTTHRPVGLT